MVERKLPKLKTRVRFPSLAPIKKRQEAFFFIKGEKLKREFVSVEKTLSMRSKIRMNSFVNMSVFCGYKFFRMFF